VPLPREADVREAMRLAVVGPVGPGMVGPVEGRGPAASQSDGVGPDMVGPVEGRGPAASQSDGVGPDMGDS
jgi:hypothetical protein